MKIIDEESFENADGYRVGCMIVENVADLLSPQIIHDVKECDRETLPITVLGFKALCLSLLTGLCMSMEKEKNTGFAELANTEEVLKVLVENYDVMFARFQKILTLIKVGFLTSSESIQ